MPESGGQPEWVSWIREDIAQVNRRIDNLVSKDSFREEQKRVNEKFDAINTLMTELQGAIQSEATARTTEQTLTLKQAAADKDKLLATERATKWQWFLIVAGPIVTWFISNALRPGG